MSHSLDYILAGLKIVGVIGAFAGLSSAESSGRRTKTKLAVIFLLIAISAEICDSTLKIQESREQTERFIRLSRPLGTIGATLFYSISLEDPLVGSYRKSAERHGVISPNPQSQPEAYALLVHAPEVIVFMYRAGRNITKDSEPDLSFEIQFPNTRIRHLTPKLPLDFESLSRSRNYMYNSEDQTKKFESGQFQPRTITAQISYKNLPDDRYSNQTIVSDHDILGATIEVRFCPVIFVNKSDPEMANKEGAALAKLLQFDGIYLAFPGRQELPITRLDKAHVATHTDPTNLCTTTTFHVPSNEAEYQKLLLP